MSFGLDIKKRIIKKENKRQQTITHLRGFSTVPKLHWCGHYLEPITQNIIPDGTRCCWRHWVGLPQRWGFRHPYYPFQEQAIDAFYHYSSIWRLKPPKIGDTELFINLALHESCINPKWRNGQVAIIVGTTGMAEGQKIIDRCKTIVKDKLPINEDYNTKNEFSINTVEFRAHPANNVDSIRSQPNMRMILVDEGAFFRQVDQQKVRDAFEHYKGGAEVKTVLISTAGDVPEGFMYDIQNEPDVTEGGVYRKFVIDYEEGLKPHPESKTTLYQKSELDEARKLRSFSRNYLHMWGHGSGDIFDIKALDRITEEYQLETNRGYTKVLSVDPGYGSSKSGLVGFEYRTGIAHVIDAEQYTRPSQSELIDHIIQKVQGRGYEIVQVDSSQPGLILDLQQRGIATKAIVFSERGQIMTDGASVKVADQKARIHPMFRALLEQLRAAKKNEKGTVDKKLGTFDLYDAFIMGLDYIITQDYRIYPVNRR